MNYGCCTDKACTRETCMKLPAGETCGECRNFPHCSRMYGAKAEYAYCDFFPRRFRKPNSAICAIAEHLAKGVTK